MPARKLADTVQFKLIVSKDLRRLIERAARKNRLTANQEAVDRLETAFPEAISEVAQNWEDMFTIMLGGTDSASVLRRLAAEMMQNPDWIDSEQGRQEMIGRLKSVLDIYLNLVQIGRGEITQ